MVTFKKEDLILLSNKMYDYYNPTNSTNPTGMLRADNNNCWYNTKDFFDWMIKFIYATTLHGNYNNCSLMIEIIYEYYDISDIISLLGKKYNKLFDKIFVNEFHKVMFKVVYDTRLIDVCNDTHKKKIIQFILNVLNNIDYNDYNDYNLSYD
jgi:hypothetical protein